MNKYTTLFNDTDSRRFGMLRCTYYRDGGPVTFSDLSSHPLILVLKGSLTVDGKWNNCTLPKGSLMAVNQKKIRKCTCEAETIMVEYLCSPRFVAYLDRCSDAFDESFSHRIPISPALYKWLDKELAAPWASDDPPIDELRVQGKSFATVMTSYPQHMLQELYVCFYACSMGDCKNCNQDDPFEARK